MLRRIITAMFFGLALMLVVASLESQPVGAQGKAKFDRGKDLYMKYCASCHGVDGKGGGPVAASLKTGLPDLTMIPKDKNGKFPALKIRNVIDGTVVVLAHGTREMPVWGQYFRERTTNSSVATGNVYALMRYVESIQAN